MPRLGDNALLKMAPLLERMAQRQPPYDLTEEPRAFLEAIGELGDGELGDGGRGEPAAAAAAALERVRATEPLLALMLEPMLGVSLAPTKISASQKIKRDPVPGAARGGLRVPPGSARMTRCGGSTT